MCVCNFHSKGPYIVHIKHFEKKGWERGYLEEFQETIIIIIKLTKRDSIIVLLKIKSQNLNIYTLKRKNNLAFEGNGQRVVNWYRQER